MSSNTASMTRSAPARRVPARGGGDAGDPRVHLRLRESPFFDGGRVVLLDDLEPLVDEGLFAVDEGHGHAGVDERHGDPASHGAGPEDDRLLDGKGRGIGGHVGDLRRRSLGKKHMAQGGRFHGAHRLGEELALAGEPLFEGQLDTGSDGFETTQRARRRRGPARSRPFWPSRRAADRAWRHRRAW